MAVGDSPDSAPAMKGFHLVKLHAIRNVIERERLLQEFHEQYLSVFFPHEDQLDSLPILLDALGKKDGFEGYCNLRVDVLYDHGKMAGGIVYEYYQRSGCGIISYFCVNNAYRGKGYGTLMVRAAEREIHETALRLGRPYANAVFMETNMPGGPDHGEDFSVEERFRTFDQLGYKRVDYQFSQPPLEDHKEPSDTLFLTVCVHAPHRLLRAPNDKCGWRLPMTMLHDWMVEYWLSSDADVTKRPEYHRIVKWFEETNETSVSLHSLLDTHVAKH